jgi:2'-5' RNA ligase
MNDPASFFKDAWARFQALDSLQLVGDSSEWEWTRGRAQNLAFLVRVEDRAAREHLARMAERLAAVPGVEPLPDWFWHVTVKLAGFQVIRRVHQDDVLQRDVPRIGGKARAVVSREDAVQARLGLANGFASVVFVEVQDDGRLRRLNARLMEGVPEIARYPIDGAGFLPHVSVARFTSSDGLDELKATLAALRAEGPGPSFPVRRVEFVKAWVSEAVPEFDVLATYALAKDARERSPG